MLLAPAYFPPVEYFALLARDFVPGLPAGDLPIIYIEACEHYQKQSWRTRCRILGANGPEILQVPIVHGPCVTPDPDSHSVTPNPDSHSVTPDLIGGLIDARSIRNIRVEYDTPWIVRTQRALDAAYESSPFYEYYRDGIFAILESQPETLLELDLALTRHLLERLGIGVELRLTEDFAAPGSVPDDYREILHPKRPNSVLRDLGLDAPYYQVFSAKFGFTPGLSILDLLFNEGPVALTHLMPQRP